VPVPFGIPDSRTLKLRIPAGSFTGCGMDSKGMPDALHIETKDQILNIRESRLQECLPDAHTLDINVK
jgi:hypothetical protein